MLRYRYSAWDGSQEAFHPAPADVLESLADALLQEGNLQKALRLLLQRGMMDRQGRFVPGLQHLLDRLRALKDQHLQRYNPDSALDTVRRRLEDIVARERQTLAAQLAATQQRLQDSPTATPETAQQYANEQRAVQEMTDTVAERQAFLDSLTTDVSAAIQRLQQYDFVDRAARDDFAALLHALQQQALETLWPSMLQRLHNMQPTEVQRLQEMMSALNRLLAQRHEGKDEDFQAFVETYRDLLPHDMPDSLEEFVAQLAQHLRAMQALLNSMTDAKRQELQGLMDQLLADAPLQQALTALLQHLHAHLQDAGLGTRLPFQGETELPLPDALRLIEKLQAMEHLEDALERVLWGTDVQQLDAEAVRQLMGEEAHGQVRALQELAARLEQQGYIRHSDEALTLTARGVRQIAEKAMRDIFASMRQDQFGQHGVARRGQRGQRTEEAHAYTFGEPFDVHLVRTVMNAVLRTASAPPLRLVPGDFAVYGTEAVARCSTVLLLDMSGSMERQGRFTAAKKVALALDALIRTQFPRDTLHIVGFYTYAQELRIDELPYLTPKPFGMFPYMYSDMDYNAMGYLDLQVEAADAIAGRVEVPQAFTNIQAGLQVAIQVLARRHAANQQVILITDGEPTAHVRDDKICLEYPPSPQTLLETLKEVKRCTRRGITINTFMLGQDTSMARFVTELTRINRGRTFFTAPDNLGDYILVDYLANRRKKIA